MPAPEFAFPLEEVARLPKPGSAGPVSVTFTPDGKALTYLLSASGDLTRQLYTFDLESRTQALAFAPSDGVTEQNLSPEEKLRRERSRERGLGVTSYAWAEEGERLLIPVRGAIWLKDGLAGPARELVPRGASPALDPQLSRDGSLVGFVRDAELYVVKTSGGAPRQITRGARGTGKTNGLAEYVAQEEMGRSHGFWISRDAKSVAYTEVDETHIPEYGIPHLGKPTPSAEAHRYPFAGKPNAKVRLGIVSAEGGATRWLELRMQDTPPEDVYLARVEWFPDGSLVVALLNRAQTRLELKRFDRRSGRSHLLLTEESKVWVNLHDVLRPLSTGGFLWASERTGHRHLYLHDGEGRLVRTLTEGDWQVDSIADVDESSGTVYFHGTRDAATEAHVYRVPLAGGPVTKLSSAPGFHRAVFDRQHRRWVDLFDSLISAPMVTVRDLNGQPVVELPATPDPRIQELGLLPPELVSLRARDGTLLHAAVYRPPPSAGPPPYATLVSVYGGPHAQRVRNDWDMTADLRAQYQRSQGYLVFVLDNRGSARRGLAFEGAIRHAMGSIEVADQVDGVRWLVERGLADPARVGIYGWSYGGYMAAMALAKAPDVFRAAVAGAPVSSWDGYDTCYTERYMGTPAENPKGYEESSVLTHVGAIKGSLLLVHGMIDENVHFRHTARLITALIKAGKPYELMAFPDERHAPRGEADRVYMERGIAEFFDEKLRGKVRY